MEILKKTGGMGKLIATNSAIVAASLWTLWPLKDWNIFFSKQNTRIHAQSHEEDHFQVCLVWDRDQNQILSTGKQKGDDSDVKYMLKCPICYQQTNSSPLLTKNAHNDELYLQAQYIMFS